MTDLKIHPFASFYPYMTDEELQEMANDILENGLIHPIVVKNDVIIVSCNFQYFRIVVTSRNIINNIGSLS